MTELVETVIAEAIDYLVANWQDQPDLDHLARRAGYEPTYFQKLFRDRVGISPKRMIQYMSMRRARDLLMQGASVLDVSHSTGLSGAGRLYDLFVNAEAATPGEVGRRGQGLHILYGWYPTPLGEVLIARTQRGVCWLGFVVDGKRDMAESRMRKHWPLASFAEDADAVRTDAAHIMRIWAGRGDNARLLRLDLYGTNFQIQVWQALLKIPCGETVSYQSIARDLGNPKASRAVGTAVGANPISLLIPCHRVIQASGIVENYGWGSPRKKLILGMEGEMAAAPEIAQAV